MASLVSRPVVAIALLMMILVGCRSLPKLQSNHSREVKIWSGGVSVAQTYPDAQLKATIARKLKLKSGQETQVFRRGAVDSATVGTQRFMFVADSLVYPLRTVAPYYLVAANLPDGHQLLLNHAAWYGPGHNSNYLSTGAIAVVAAAAVQQKANVGQLVTVGVAAGVSLGVLDAFFGYILKWPYDKVWLDYNPKTKSVMVLKDNAQTKQLIKSLGL